MSSTIEIKESLEELLPRSECIVSTIVLTGSPVVIEVKDLAVINIEGDSYQYSYYVLFSRDGKVYKTSNPDIKQDFDLLPNRFGAKIVFLKHQDPNREPNVWFGCEAYLGEKENNKVLASTSEIEDPSELLDNDEGLFFWYI